MKQLFGKISPLSLSVSSVLLCVLCVSVYPQSIKIQPVVDTLANGLKYILLERHESPQIACRLYYRVGSAYERPGATGLSHMLEHMMFKGTRQTGTTDPVRDSAYNFKIDSLMALAEPLAGPPPQADQLRAAAKKLWEEQRGILVQNELWDLYQRNGGDDLNAFTSNLLTAYIVTLPANKLELFFWLEADRMAGAVLRQFFPERDVVAEERRLRYENSPYGRYRETLQAMFYEAHPYRFPVIGIMSDIQHMNRQLLQDHYRTYYQPNNAVLVLVGDFQTARARQLIRDYFGRLARGPALPPLAFSEPTAVGEKRFTQVKDVNPRLDFYFHLPGFGHPDVYTMDIMEGALNGESGRLHKKLVIERGLATSVAAGNAWQPNTGQFSITVTLQNRADPDTVEKLVWEELAGLQAAPLSPREFQKIKNQVESGAVNRLREIDYVADQLGYYEIFGDWKIINQYADQIQAVTPAQAQAAARLYFQKSNLTLGQVKKSPEEAPHAP